MATIARSFSPVFCADGVILPYSAQEFDLAQTLDCGQAFRWTPNGRGGFTGVAFKKVCDISPIDSTHLLCAVSRADFENIWQAYFDLNRNYATIKQTLSAHPVFARAITYAPGLRLLRQEPWEALCSFIISQNNNLPRIKGIVARLCELLGDPLGEGLYAFPAPEQLAVCSLEALAPLRAGFRARYLLDAAQKVSDGTVDLTALPALTTEQARATLMQITGVGVKVADCALLYGFGRLDCFPVDVWIARAMEQLFPDGLPSCACGDAGIAQQYLFHYVRTCPDALPPATNADPTTKRRRKP